jgi:hypothetical protein
MKLQAFTLAAALAFAASGAFAATTKDTHVVRVGPNGGVTHVQKHVEKHGNVKHVTRVVHRTSTPRHTVRHVAHVVRHDARRVAHNTRRHVNHALVRHQTVHYAASSRPALNRHRG